MLQRGSGAGVDGHLLFKLQQSFCLHLLFIAPCMLQASLGVNGVTLQVIDARASGSGVMPAPASSLAMRTWIFTMWQEMSLQADSGTAHMAVWEVHFVFLGYAICAGNLLGRP